MNANENSQNNWIERIKSTKITNNIRAKPRTKSTSSTTSSSSSRTSPNEFEFVKQATSVMTSINQINDFTSASSSSSADFFINTNNETNTNTTITTSNTTNNDNNLNEFDLNNNDLAYSSLCFDNIDLTSTTTTTSTTTSTTATHKLNDENTSNLGLKFVNTNHNPDTYQRSNSVPVKNYDTMFTSQPNDLNNLDLNYSSLYFEAIDLCLPHTTNNHHAFDYSSTYDIPAFNANKLFINQSNSTIPALNASSDIEESHNINTPKLETSPLHESSHHLESHLNETNLINETVRLEDNENKTSVPHSSHQIDHSHLASLIASSPTSTTDPILINLSSESPVKATKKSKTKLKSNTSALDQKCLENNEIKIDGVDLRPLIKDYYNMVYTCMIKLCGCEFEQNADLVKHLKEIHQIELVNNDSITGKNGKLSYKCIFDEKTCGKKLETLNRIADHICKAHLSKIDYAAIGSAEKLFSPVVSLKNTQPNDSQHKEMLIAKLNQKPLSFNNILICSYNQCLWSFQFEEALKLHKLKHKCGLDLNDQINLDIIKEKTKNAERNYACTTCNSKFVRPSHLKTHLKSHETNLFPCDYCTETFFKINQLLSHINEKHKESEKIFRCQYEGCMKAYYCKMYLTSHITKSHLKQQENESEKICTECNIKFKQVWLKRQHDEIKHKKSQNLKTFKCTYEQCSKEFMTPSKLHRHNLTHLNAKSYKCEYENCNACFKRQYQLNSHMKSHTANSQDPAKVIYYKCNQTNCRSKFKSQEKLDLHKQSHLNQQIKNENDEELSDVENLNDPNECLLLPHTEIVHLKEDNSIDLFEENSKLNNNNPTSNQQQQIFGLNNNNNFSNLKQFEFKCIYCQFKFDSNDQLNTHLKSHIDINKANQKLNDYLIEISQNQKENIKYQDDTTNTNLYHSNQNLNDQIKFIETEPETHYSYLNLISEEDNVVNLDDNESDKHNKNNEDEVDESDFPSLNLDHSDHTNLIDYFDATNNNNALHNQEIKTNFQKEDEHVININSDDEEYVTCSVVLENLSGSARTDYKSNHIYIEKYRSKRKSNERFFSANKKIKGETDEPYESVVKSVSPLTTASPASTSDSLPSPPPQPPSLSTQALMIQLVVDSSSTSTSTPSTSFTNQVLNESLKRKLKLKSTIV